MADPTRSVDPSAQTENPPSQPVALANPRQHVATGRSHMAEYGAAQTAQGTIGNWSNEPSYPLIIHWLNAERLYETFRIIIGQLLWTFTRELGFPDPTVPNARNALRAFANSVAFAALHAAYAVTYNKARANDPFTTYNMPNPSFTTETFPVFITAMINSLGPIQRGDYPSRRKHVPLLNFKDVQALVPQGMPAATYNLFKEKIQKTRILLANVELHGSASSPWWMLYPQDITKTSVPDHLATADDAVFWTKKVFSPVRFEEIEQFLKLSAVFMPGPLISPGPGAYSASNWYFESELSRKTGIMPVPSDFPNEARAPPYFWTGCTAFVFIVEKKQIIIDVEDVELSHSEDDDTESLASAAASSRSRTPARSTRVKVVSRQTKRLRRNTQGDFVTPESPTYAPRSPTARAAPAEEHDTMYRIVYYYFDHVAIMDAHPNDYVTWAYNLNQAI